MSNPTHPLTRLDDSDALFPILGGTLFVLVWEWAITLDDEVELIWPRRNRSALKWLYILARYLVFCSQTFHRCLEMSIRYQYNINPQRLRVWYCSQALMAALSISILEAVLMMRVYALYQKRTVAVTLGSLLAMELIVAIVGLYTTLSRETFIPLYAISHLPKSFIYFGVSGLVVQCIILVLTLVKYLGGSMKAVPIVQLMARDGTLTFFFITILSLIVVVCTFRQQPFGIVAFSWLLTIVSASTCRLIVNMLRMPLAHEVTLSTHVQFTTMFTDRVAFETVHSRRNSISVEGWTSRPYNFN